MTIEIISIGSELLTGQTINTNASVMAQTMLSHGFAIHRITVLPDKSESLRQGIEEALARSSIVIASGGLGPTGDDVTRDVVSKIYGVSLETNEVVRHDLIERFGENFGTIEDQARLPKGCQVIYNPIGTASGFILEGNASLIVLPGVPNQMEAMLDEVLSYLAQKIPDRMAMETLFLSLISEKDVDPTLRLLEKEHPSVEFGICPGYGTLSVYLQGKDRVELVRLRAILSQKFSMHLFSTKSKRIEEAFHEWMIEKGKTVAFAESCTGGHLAALITKLAGASHYFLGSMVTYSNLLKESALGVSSLKEHGAVSPETVTEMASGVKRLTGADYVVAISGIAGPTGGTPEKPVGTIWIAIQTPEELFVGCVPRHPSLKRRGLIIQYASTYALAVLLRYLKDDVRPFS